MTAQEIVKVGPGGVRNNSTNMAEYERLFKEQFGYKPECPTCGSVRDWNLFKAFANGESFTKPQIIMSDKTFELINNAIIYSYDYEDEKINRVIRKRVYGNLMTDQFAEEYLTNGSEDQIEERKKEFRLLPEKFRDSVEEANVDVNDTEKLAELKATAAEKGYPEEEYQDIDNDADMSVYIETKELEEEAETKRLQAEAEERMRVQREEKDAEEKRVAQEEAEKKEKEEVERLASEKAASSTSKPKTERKK